VTRPKPLLFSTAASHYAHRIDLAGDGLQRTQTAISCKELTAAPFSPNRPVSSGGHVGTASDTMSKRAGDIVGVHTSPDRSAAVPSAKAINRTYHRTLCYPDNEALNEQIHHFK
jgi:hypothetical protein